MTTRELRPRPSRVPSMPVLDLAMRVGDHFLASGMSANDVVVQMLRVTRAYGLSGVHVDLTYTSITVTHHRGASRAPLTVSRVVQPLVVDYTKVRDLDRLLARIEEGLDVTAATAEYDRLSYQLPPYPRWLSSCGAGGIAAGVTLTFTTSVVMVLMSFLAAASMDRLQMSLYRRRVPPFFSQALVAGGITLFAAGVDQLARQGVPLVDGADPTLIVVGGIVMLLAGVMIVGAVQDAIDQFYVTASARVMEVVMRTAGIVAGILVALNFLESRDIAFEILNNPASTAPVLAQYAGAGLICLSFGIYCYADVATTALTTAIGLVGWSVYLTFAASDTSEVLSNAAAAFVVGALATIAVRGTHAPGFGMESGALLPLVPGLMLLNGLLRMMESDPANPAIVAGGRTLFIGLLVALGIAAGATLGTYLARPVDDQLRRLRKRVKMPGRSRPPLT